MKNVLNMLWNALLLAGMGLSIYSGALVAVANPITALVVLFAMLLVGILALMAGGIFLAKARAMGEMTKEQLVAVAVGKMRQELRNRAQGKAETMSEPEGGLN